MARASDVVRSESPPPPPLPPLADVVRAFCKLAFSAGVPMEVDEPSPEIVQALPVAVAFLQVMTGFDYGAKLATGLGWATATQVVFSAAVWPSLLARHPVLDVVGGPRRCKFQGCRRHM